MTRGSVVTVVGVSLAIAAIAATLVHLAGRDRAELAARFSAEQQAQVAEAAREIEAELDDVADDLRFASQLVHGAGSAADRRRELGALLAAVKQYRVAASWPPRSARGSCVRTGSARSWGRCGAAPGRPCGSPRTTPAA